MLCCQKRLKILVQGRGAVQAGRVHRQHGATLQLPSCNQPHSPNSCKPLEHNSTPSRLTRITPLCISFTARRAVLRASSIAECARPSPAAAREWPSRRLLSAVAGQTAGRRMQAGYRLPLAIPPAADTRHRPPARPLPSHCRPAASTLARRLPRVLLCLNHTADRSTQRFRYLGCSCDQRQAGQAVRARCALLSHCCNRPVAFHARRLACKSSIPQQARAAAAACSPARCRATWSPWPASP